MATPERILWAGPVCSACSKPIRSSGAAVVRQAGVVHARCLARARQLEARAPQARRLRPPACPRILVVDDHADNLDLYTSFLIADGFEALKARDGQEAIDRAREHQPHVIVMDLGLPVLDGWEATRRLKADPPTARIPIIALTAHVFRGGEPHAKAAGCDVYLIKPCLPEDLAREIRRMLRRRSRAR